MHNMNHGLFMQKLVLTLGRTVPQNLLSEGPHIEGLCLNQAISICSYIMQILFCSGTSNLQMCKLELIVRNSIIDECFLPGCAAMLRFLHVWLLWNLCRVTSKKCFL